MGNIIPEMGTKAFDTSSCGGLFGKTRQGVLALLYGHAGSSFYTKQIIDAVMAGRGAVQRELKNLTNSGILVREIRGRQVYYRANEKCLIFEELNNIVRNAGPAVNAVQETRVPYAPGVKSGALRPVVPKRKVAAFCRRNHIQKLSLFGSVLREEFRPDSDIDVLVEYEPDHFPGFFKLADMQDELSALFGRKVDLRTPGDLSRYIRQRVLDEAQVQYAAAR